VGWSGSGCALSQRPIAGPARNKGSTDAEDHCRAYRISQFKRAWCRSGDRTGSRSDSMRSRSVRRTNGTAPLGGAVAVFPRYGAEASGITEPRVEVAARISQDLNGTLDLEQIHQIVVQSCIGSVAGLALTIPGARAPLYSFEGKADPLTRTTCDRFQNRDWSLPHVRYYLRQTLPPFTVPFDTHSNRWRVYVSRESHLQRRLGT